MKNFILFKYEEDSPIYRGLIRRFARRSIVVVVLEPDVWAVLSCVCAYAVSVCLSSVLWVS